MKTWNLEQRVRRDLAFAAAFFGIWALALCSGALLESTRLMDFRIKSGLIPAISMAGYSPSTDNIIGRCHL